MKFNIKKLGSHIKTSFKDMAKINKKALKNGSYSVLSTVLVVAVLILINLVVGELPEKYTQIDLSDTQLYTITDETIEFINNLDQNVTIYYIVQNGNEDNRISKLLSKYEANSKHITVEKKDPVLYPAFTSQYTEDTVTENSVIIVSGEKSKVVAYNTMYQSEYDYMTGSSTVSGFDGEGQIDSAISYVTSENIPIIYSLTGHNEISLPTDFTDSLEKNNYDVQSLNLLTKETVPEDASMLLISSPETDISEEEADKIISYLENGGKALIFTDYIKTETPNLDKVLDNYGVKKGTGVVFEGDTKHYISQMPYYLVPEVKDTDASTDVAQKGYYVLMPVAQPIVTADTYRDTLNIYSILSTSDQAYIKTNVDNMKTFEKESGDEEGTFDIGVKINESISDEEETRIVYYSSTGILDSTSNQQVSGGNYSLLLENISWLSGNEENDSNIINVAAKSMATEYLTIPQYDSGYWSVMTCGIIPALVLIVGGIVWLKRRKH